MIDWVGPWPWVVGGVILLILELLSGGGFLLLIACSALVVAIAVWLFPILQWPSQFLIFSIGAVISCYLWWYYLKKHRCQEDNLKLNRRSEQYIGRVLTLETDIVNGRGKVRIGDSIWRVEGEDLPKGTKVMVTKADGVILIVKPVEHNG